MSHKSGHIIIQKSAASTDSETVQSATVDLFFPPGTELETKMRKVRQVERLLDKLDHDHDED
jgi:hypothetical protein